MKEVFDTRAYIEKAYSNYDGDPDVSVRGSLDVKKVDAHTITYQVKGSNGRAAVKEL